MSTDAFNQYYIDKLPDVVRAVRSTHLPFYETVRREWFPEKAAMIETKTPEKSEGNINFARNVRSYDLLQAAIESPAFYERAWHAQGEPAAAEQVRFCGLLMGADVQHTIKSRRLEMTEQAPYGFDGPRSEPTPPEFVRLFNPGEELWRFDSPESVRKTPIYVTEKREDGTNRAVVNPEWEAALYYDDVWVQPGWLTEYVPKPIGAEEPLDAKTLELERGDWKWTNPIKETEGGRTYRDDTEGYYRCTFNYGWQVDLSKIKRIRRRVPQ